MHTLCIFPSILNILLSPCWYTTSPGGERLRQLTCIAVDINFLSWVWRFTRNPTLCARSVFSPRMYFRQCSQIYILLIGCPYSSGYGEWYHVPISYRPKLIESMFLDVWLFCVSIKGTDAFDFGPSYVALKKGSLAYTTLRYASRRIMSPLSVHWPSRLPIPLSQRFPDYHYLHYYASVLKQAAIKGLC